MYVVKQPHSLRESLHLQDWDQPEYIADPDAKKPDDWDDDMDGEWEPPMIPNPEYKVRQKPHPLQLGLQTL